MISRWIAFLFLFLGIGVAAWGECAEIREKAPPHRVLVGSILNNHPLYMKEFFTSLRQLTCSDCSIDYCFVVISDQNIAQELIKTLNGEDSSRISVIDARLEPSTAGSVVWQIADYKNRILKLARDKKYDYVFLIDSRIVLHPKTLEQLISAKKEIIANIFWTNVGGEEAPQVWLSDLHTQFEINGSERISAEEMAKRKDEFFIPLKTPGIYQVGGLGACTLISKAVLDKGVSFGRLKNVTIESEDAHFCLRAEALDIPLFVDTHYPAYCLLSETGDSSLEGLAAYRANCTSP